MELHEQQQFDFLLATAVDRYVDRIIQRNQGAANALVKLIANRDGEGLWLNQFVDAFFQDFLLDNTGGACFILKALAKKTITPPSGTEKIETLLIRMAKDAFADLLARKTQEFLEQESAYGGG